MLHNTWVLPPEVEPTTFPSTLVLARKRELQRELVKRNGTSRNCELSHDQRSCDHMMTSFSKLHSCKESILMIIMHHHASSSSSSPVQLVRVCIIAPAPLHPPVMDQPRTVLYCTVLSLLHCTIICTVLPLLYCTTFTALYYLYCTVLLSAVYYLSVLYSPKQLLTVVQLLI